MICLTWFVISITTTRTEIPDLKPYRSENKLSCLSFARLRTVRQIPWGAPRPCVIWLTS
jgi:hypothetical protein